MKYILIVILLLWLNLIIAQEIIMPDFLSIRVFDEKEQIEYRLREFIPKDSLAVIFAFSPVGCTGTVVSVLSEIEKYERERNRGIKKIFLICHERDGITDYARFLSNYWQKRGVKVLRTSDLSTFVQYKIDLYSGITAFFPSLDKQGKIFSTMQLFVEPDLIQSALIVDED